MENGSVGKWLLRGSEVPGILANVSRLFNHGAGLLQEINRLRVKRGHDPLGSAVKADELLKAALVSVRVTMCKRGAPADLAIIYSLEDDEAKKWEKALRTRTPRVEMGEETQEEMEVSHTSVLLLSLLMRDGCTQLSVIVPPESAVIGYVTTGHFSLSQGQGFGIGAIAVHELLRLQEQSHRSAQGDRNSTFSTKPWLPSRILSSTTMTKQRLLVKVRNGNSQQCRPAIIDILDA